MKTKVKTIKAPKPRNPLVVAAKFRKAGAHDGGNPARAARRAAKHGLLQWLTGRKSDQE